ncbi:MAG: peptidoglycan-binding protein [Bacilli bacterium]|nr:peptidoglycan-binding protein [Bacilli bacterium]
MSSIYIGSARIDENKKISGGKAGDQLQSINLEDNDYTGEVSLQKFYVHSKGWYIIRPRKISHANNLASKMIVACNNPNIGYDQSERLGIISGGIDCRFATECDCSSLVRRCIIESAKKDPGNFTTATEAIVLNRTQLFLQKIVYKSGETQLYDGDILVTKTSGHTAIVVSGNPRPNISIPNITLKYGSIGIAVKNLQYCLNMCGANLNVDGSFGKLTRNAVKKWQNTYDLDDDGSYGPKSRKKMKELLG